jgi:hypothetical protein
VLPELDGMVGDGLVTIENVEVVAYRAGGERGAGGAGVGGRSATHSRLLPSVVARRDGGPAAASSAVHVRRRRWRRP